MTTLINIQNWMQMEKKARNKVEKKATDYVRARVKRVLDEAVRVSPQWSGNFAANWGIETSAQGRLSYESLGKVTPWNKLIWWDIGADSTKFEKKIASTKSGKFEYARYAGQPLPSKYSSETKHYPAIYGENGEGGIKWNTKIRLVNYSGVDEKLASGEIKHLRQVNLIPNGQLSVTLYLKDKYKYLS